MKLFVWDLHGVLEKGNEIALLEISNNILEKFGYNEKFSIDHCMKLNGLSWHQYFSYLLPNEDKKKHIYLQNECIKYSQEFFFEAVAKHLKLNDNAYDVLKQIEISEHNQILISNTQQDSLSNYLSVLQIDNFFSKTQAFATNPQDRMSLSKKEILEKHLKTNDYEELISIGDSLHDIALASLHKRGKSYLYTHPNYPIRPGFATYKINDLRKVLVEI